MQGPWYGLAENNIHVPPLLHLFFSALSKHTGHTSMKEINEMSLNIKSTHPYHTQFYSLICYMLKYYEASALGTT